ncbi:MAG: class I SAM-dependent methyltransferase [Cyclobacteriaceae bacterium]|nr:class I SAM-dependent methyltransferase [Cyclobacteriaceae bacterium]
MKKQVFPLFVLFFCSVAVFSCKEKTKNNSKEHLFKESIDSTSVGEAGEVEAEVKIDINSEVDPERGQWQSPELVIRKFGGLEHKIVADIGSGTGYFTIPLARMAKKVIAIEIEQRYLDYIEDRKLELPIEHAEVIETRLTVEDEPNLHAEEVDAVLMVNVFYYLQHRVDYMRIVKKAIKENGLLVLVDFKPGDMPVGPSENKVPAPVVVDILRKAGFSSIEVDVKSLQYQYIITAN